MSHGAPAHVLARVRLVVARHPWIYWIAVVALAGMVTIGVVDAMAKVDAARRSWGTQQAVWTATAAIKPGAVITAEHSEVPTAVVPNDAVDASPVGAVAKQHIAVGEIVTSADVTRAGPAGLIPEGWVAFAVPESVDHFAAGDHVNVYTTDRLISDGVVVEAGDSDVMVAIAADAAPAMATALQSGAVTVALTSAP
jgi:hypothetical protein